MPVYIYLNLSKLDLFNTESLLSEYFSQILIKCLVQIYLWYSFINYGQKRRNATPNIVKLFHSSSEILKKVHGTQCFPEFFDLFECRSKYTTKEAFQDIFFKLLAFFGRRNVESQNNSALHIYVSVLSNRRKIYSFFFE